MKCGECKHWNTEEQPALADQPEISHRFGECQRVPEDSFYFETNDEGKVVIADEYADRKAIIGVDNGLSYNAPIVALFTRDSHFCSMFAPKTKSPPRPPRQSKTPAPEAP